MNILSCIKHKIIDQWKHWSSEHWNELNAPCKSVYTRRGRSVKIADLRWQQSGSGDWQVIGVQHTAWPRSPYAPVPPTDSRFRPVIAHDTPLGDAIEEQICPSCISRNPFTCFRTPLSLTHGSRVLKTSYTLFYPTFLSYNVMVSEFHRPQEIKAYGT